MSFEKDLQDLNYIPETTIEGDGLPRISWLSSTKRGGILGKFYARASQMPGLTAPWEAVELFDDEEGFVTPSLDLCIIRTRAQAYSETIVGDRRVRTWHPQWKPDAGMRIYTELLCYIKGYEGLVVWPVKGLIGKGVCAVRNPDSVFGRMREVEKEAKKTATRPIPSFAFWTPVVCPTDRKGKPVLTSTGHGSEVIIPVAAVPDVIDRDVCAKLYVGSAMLQQARAAWQEYEGWSRELRSNEPDDAPQAPSPRNAPSPFDQDDASEGF